MRILGILFLGFIAFISLISADANYKENLSDYGFFKGTVKDQIPADGVMPYALNSPLFSDYASKLRFVRLPEGKSVAYNPDSVLQFPVGAAIVKTFYYPIDERNPKKGRRLMETRILLHEAKGWVALPYIWNKEQTDAVLEVAGGSDQVSWIDGAGKKQSFEYQVPNMNQCKGCHERSGEMTPIGPSVRQLNDGHQLQNWSTTGLLKGLPKEHIPALVNYLDASASLDDRVKAYLDINCAHCHNATGPARSSGLYLDWNSKDRTAYGFFKPPVAAGRGSGNLSYDIVPGKPDQSILYYRMASRDPGVMMPELGRQLTHHEGVELVRNWIQSMN
jgi:uncharacterized repeat protein (TIGR03806 family)